MLKRLGFTYLFCNDLEKMKWFYEDLLQLDLIWNQDDQLAFQIDGHQLSIQFHQDFMPPSPGFSIQPGWEGGTKPRTSWSIAVGGEAFKETVQRLSKNRVKAYYKEPQWKGYWSFPVLDPMNNTIEITCTDVDYHT